MSGEKQLEPLHQCTYATTYENCDGYRYYLGITKCKFIVVFFLQLFAEMKDGHVLLRFHESAADQNLFNIRSVFFHELALLRIGTLTDPSLTTNKCVNSASLCVVLSSLVNNNFFRELEARSPRPGGAVGSTAA